MNVKQKMLAYFSKTNGYNTLTTKQAQSKFGIKNVGARIDELRSEGYSIYLNRKTVNGKRVSFYRLGTPSRAMVAAAHATLGASAFA